MTSWPFATVAGSAEIMGTRIMAAAGLIAIAPAAAQQPAPDTVEVEGRSREQIRTLATTIARPGAHGVIPRFRDRLCIDVRGLAPRYADVIASRIAEVAREAGVRVGDRRCQANVVVLAPADPTAYVDYIIDQHWSLIGDPVNGLPPRSLLIELRKPRPVRWFSATRSIPLGSGMWRLSSPARVDKLATYIVVDVTRMGGISWGQLGDYIAMVALANPAMSGSYPPAASALSIFDDRDAGRAMATGRTAFDRSLLHALYDGDDYLSAKLQVRQLVNAMVHHGGTAVGATP